MRIPNDDEMEADAGAQRHAGAAIAKVKMRQSTLHQRCARMVLRLLVIAATMPVAVAAELPPGWEPLNAASGDNGALTLSGHFQDSAHSGVATLVAKSADGPYGLAVTRDAASGGQASIVKTFSDIKANPPRLSLVKPGKHLPVCHDGGQCVPLNIANEAIGLCFGEASCTVIYFDGGAFGEIAVTD